MPERLLDLPKSALVLRYSRLQEVGSYAEKWVCRAIYEMSRPPQRRALVEIHVNLDSRLHKERNRALMFLSSPSLIFWNSLRGCIHESSGIREGTLRGQGYALA